MGRGVPYSYNQAIKETLPAQIKNSDINAIYDDNCKLRTEKVTIASILNKYFTSIGKKIQKLFTITPSVSTTYLHMAVLIGGGHLKKVRQRTFQKIISYMQLIF